jgi:hypothetical protein
MLQLLAYFQYTETELAVICDFFTQITERNFEEGL